MFEYCHSVSITNSTGIVCQPQHPQIGQLLQVANLCEISYIILANVQLLQVVAVCKVSQG